MYYFIFNDAIVSFIKSPKRILETPMVMHEFLIYNHYSLHKLVHQHLSNNVCILIIGLHACSKFGIIASMNFQINNEYCYYKKILKVLITVFHRVYIAWCDLKHCTKNFQNMLNEKIVISIPFGWTINYTCI